MALYWLSMEPRITAQEARDYVARHEVASAVEREELRHATPEAKMKQLVTLMQWVRDFGWAEALREDEEQVRERWIRLKDHYAV